MDGVTASTLACAQGSWATPQQLLAQALEPLPGASAVSHEPPLDVFASGRSQSVSAGCLGHLGRLGVGGLHPEAKRDTNKAPTRRHKQHRENETGTQHR